MNDLKIKNKNINLKINIELYDEIANACKIYDCYITQFIRSAIKNYINVCKNAQQRIM